MGVWVLPLKERGWGRFVDYGWIHGVCSDRGCVGVTIDEEEWRGGLSIMDGSIAYARMFVIALSNIAVVGVVCVDDGRRWEC